MTLDHLDTIISFVAIITGVSLLVTTLTQATSAALGLRGTNLRWGIETLLKHADPNLADQARTIADKVLQHGLISDSSVSGGTSTLTARWRLASGIRQDELVAILHSLADTAAAAPDGAKPEPWAVALQDSLDVIDKAEAERVLALAPVIRKALADDAATAEEIVSRLSTSAEALTGQIEQWFDSVMDRVSQRFTLHARIWTGVFAAVLAFGLHLDAFRLFTQLSGDSDLRARVLASADTLLKKADDIQGSPTAAPASAYLDAMRVLLATYPTELKGLPTPTGFKNDASARDWLSAALKSANIEPADPWLNRFEELVPRATLQGAANELNAAIHDKLAFGLVPDPFPPIDTYWTPTWMHFWGTLASAALLSLGAPFWFNILKDLTNLRPVIAKKQDQEAAADGGA